MDTNIVCPHCGSSNVAVQHAMFERVSTQPTWWTGVHQNTFCRSCFGTLCVNWRPTHA